LPYGISGDIPIVLVMLDKTDDIDIVREVLKAHEYWRLKKLAVDLVILNEEEKQLHQPGKQFANGYNWPKVMP